MHCSFVDSTLLSLSFHSPLWHVCLCNCTLEYYHCIKSLCPDQRMHVAPTRTHEHTSKHSHQLCSSEILLWNIKQSHVCGFVCVQEYACPVMYNFCLCRTRFSQQPLLPCLCVCTCVCVWMCLCALGLRQRWPTLAVAPSPWPRHTLKWVTRATWC